MKAVYKANTKNMTAIVELYINNKKVGEGPVDRLMMANYSISETFDVGVDMGSPVSKTYNRDNEFSGNLDRENITLTD